MPFAFIDVPRHPTSGVFLRAVPSGRMAKSGRPKLLSISTNGPRVKATELISTVHRMQPPIWVLYTETPRAFEARLREIEFVGASEIEVLRATNWQTGRDPLVSVVICVFNDKTNVVKAIESVLTQTLNSAEAFVVDDCSTDGTYEYLTIFSVITPELSYLKPQATPAAPWPPERWYQNCSSSLRDIPRQR